MTDKGALRFSDPAWTGGRIPLMCGDVMVGAVFPPVGHPPNLWAWRVWVHGDAHAPDGRARTEAAAKAAAISAFRKFLDRSGLQIKEVPRPDPIGEALNSGDGAYRP